jgi:hypothetical protein
MYLSVGSYTDLKMTSLISRSDLKIFSNLKNLRVLVLNLSIKRLQRRRI